MSSSSSGNLQDTNLDALELIPEYSPKSADEIQIELWIDELNQMSCEELEFPDISILNRQCNTDADCVKYSFSVEQNCGISCFNNALTREKLQELASAHSNKYSSCGFPVVSTWCESSLYNCSCVNNVCA